MLREHVRLGGQRPASKVKDMMREAAGSLSGLKGLLLATLSIDSASLHYPIVGLDQASSPSPCAVVYCSLETIAPRAHDPVEEIFSWWTESFAPIAHTVAFALPGRN